MKILPLGHHKTGFKQPPERSTVMSSKFEAIKGEAVRSGKCENTTPFSDDQALLIVFFIFFPRRFLVENLSWVEKMALITGALWLDSMIT